MGIEQVMYALKEDGIYSSFYKEQKAYGYSIIPESVEESIKVKLIEDPDGDYYGYYDFKEEELYFIYKNRAQVSMCFGCGLDYREKNGEGRGVPLRIVEI